MRIKILALTMCICTLCMSASGPALAEVEAEAADLSGFTEVYDRAGLEAIANNPAGSYVLTADIDLSGGMWTPVRMNGVFDGNGHTIYNLSVTAPGNDTATTYDGNLKTYDTRFAALFSTAENAVLRDLTVLGAKIDVTTDENCFATCLIGYAKNTEITGCSVSGSVLLSLTSTMAGVAGLVGFGYGCTVTGSSADVTLVYTDTNREVDCEEFLGGVLACGYGMVIDCSAKVRGYASIFGYAHNGGLIGMHYAFDPALKLSCLLSGCTVDAEIHFFEKVRSRRAYCKAFIGENLYEACRLSLNKATHFKKFEHKKFQTYLLPENCAAPSYTVIVSEPTCFSFGFATHTCTGCGYTYTDDYVGKSHLYGAPEITAPSCAAQGYSTYTCTLCGETKKSDFTAPVHRPGECETTLEPTYEAAGALVRRCTVCGETVETKVISRLLHVSACTLDQTTLTMPDKGSVVLTAHVEPENAANPAVIWSSSDERVAEVDAEGKVTALGCGETVITCAAEDGGLQACCTVSVRYTWWQWIIVILLFGWIWY